MKNVEDKIFIKRGIGDLGFLMIRDFKTFNRFNALMHFFIKTFVYFSLEIVFNLHNELKNYKNVILKFQTGEKAWKSL